MRSRTVTFRLAPCLFAAAVCLLLDVKSATASCGDYVHVRTPGRQTDHDQTPPADSPCAHGRCDRLPVAPPAPDPTAPTSGGGHDAVPTTLLALVGLTAVGFADAQAGVPSHVPSVPFHPPRS